MIATGLIFINPTLRRVGMNVFDLSHTLSVTTAILVTDLIIVALFFIARNKGMSYKLYPIIFSIFMVYHIPMFTEIELVHFADANGNRVTLFYQHVKEIARRQ